MSPVKAAIIGCGRMGTSIARRCRRLQDVKVCAVCDVNPKRAEILALQFDVPHYHEVDQLLEKSRPDLVLVATPPNQHVEPVVLAAQAGAHVFCEKPMSVDVASCDRMIAACDQSDVLLMIGHVGRFQPIFAHVKRLCEHGEFGQPISMSVNRLGKGWSGTEWETEWRYSRNQSGGSLLEVNSHELDLMLWVCGPPSRVFAIGHTYRQKEADYPDHCILSVEFESGAIGTLHTSQCSVLGAYGGRLDCMEGSIHFPNVWAKDPGVWVALSGQPAHFVPVPGIADATPLGIELNTLVEAILEGRSAPVTGREGRDVVELACAAYESIGTGQPVDIRHEGSDSAATSDG